MVAQTIVDQMGGINRLVSMLSAFDFCKDKNSVSFKFKGSKKANFIKITLNVVDLYDIEFLTVSKLTPKNALKWMSLNDEEITKKLIREEESYSNIAVEQLQEVFVTFTGLYLELY